MQTEKPKNTPPAQPPKRVNPLMRLIANRISMIVALVALIFAGSAACAIFAPFTFQQMIRAAQSAGLKTYTVVLSVTGNPALKVITYDADVTTQTTITRDMGILGLIYGENAQITGTTRVSLGADLKNGQFGVLSCDVDTQTLRTVESRAPLAGSAFDSQQIKQEAYLAFEQQAAQQAIVKYWPEARRRLQSQVTSWALGVTIPEQPTLAACPSNLAASATATAKP